MAHISDAFRVDMLSLGDNILVVSGSIDPSTGAGYEAPIGSIYVNITTGLAYQKINTTDLNWTTCVNQSMGPTGVGLGNVVNSVQVINAGGSPSIQDDVHTNRPAAGTAGRLFFATDQIVIYRDNGVSWDLFQPPVIATSLGFIERVDSLISFTDNTRTFTISPTVTSYQLVIGGVVNTITSTKTIVLPNTTGNYYIYFDNTLTLQYITTLTEDLFELSPLVSTIYYNATVGSALILADERHTIDIPGELHFLLHQTIGTRYINGLTIGGTYSIVGNGSVNADAQLSISNGLIRDEDIEHSIVNTGGKLAVYDLEQALSPIAQIPVWYRTGTTGIWNEKTADNYPFIYSGTAGYTGANGRLPYNQWTGTTWQLTQVASNHYVLLHIFATNNIKAPIVAVQGITDYNTVPTSAQAQAELQALVAAAPVHEVAPIASLVLKTNATYTNAVKCDPNPTTTGDAYYNWETVTNFAASAAKSFTTILPSWIVINSTYTALNGDNIIADTSGGAFTITLPPTPTTSNTIRIKDSHGSFSTNNLTVARNGSNIIAAASDLIIDLNYADITFVYQDATIGWTI